MRVAFIGKMGSGKTLLSDYMVKKYGCKKYSCARSLKDIATQIGMVGKDRSLLQKLGFAVRYYDSYFFAKNLIKDIGEEKNATIDDVRYIEEYELLKKAGFLFIKKEVKDEIRLKRLAVIGMNPTEEQFNHDSEIHIDDLPYEYKISDEIDKDIPTIYNELESILFFDKMKRGDTLWHF